MQKTVKTGALMSEKGFKKCSIILNRMHASLLCSVSVLLNKRREAANSASDAFNVWRVFIQNTQTRSLADQHKPTRQGRPNPWGTAARPSQPGVKKRPPSICRAQTRTRPTPSKAQMHLRPRHWAPTNSFSTLITFLPHIWRIALFCFFFRFQ